MSLQVSEAVIWQETAEGISLYHTETGEFLMLNETGAKIWVLVESDGERDQVISRLSLLFGAYDAAIKDKIRTDVDHFIDSMVENGLLTESVAA